MFLFRKRADHPDFKQQQKVIEELQKEVNLLRAANGNLQQQLAAAGAVAGDYMYRWRSVALPIIGSEWELRYFVLSGTSIRYYKTDRDVVFSPREEFSILGCTVEWQGLQGTRLWCWALIDPGGNLLLRVGSPNESTAMKWCSALERAGCAREDVTYSLTKQLSSPLPGSIQGQLDLSPANASTSKSAFTLKHNVSRSKSISGSTHLYFGAADFKSGPAQLQQLAKESRNTDKNSGSKHRRKPSNSSGGSSQLSRLQQTSISTADAVTTMHNTAEHATPKVHADGHAAPVSPEVGDAQGLARRSLDAAGNAPVGKKRSQPMCGSSPVHTACHASYLSSERNWYEKQTGFYNLMAVILVATNFRLALENALKYGWRYNPVRGIKDLTFGNPNVPVALCYPGLAMLAMVAFLSECLALVLMQQEQELAASLNKKYEGNPKLVAKHVQARRTVHEGSLFLLNAINTCAVIGVPWAAISITKAEPLSGGVLIGLAIVLWMKLISFHHCCSDLRTARRDGETRPGERGCPGTPAEWALLAYPENLGLKHFWYYLAAPTLSYQVNYPRSERIRWKWLARRVAELIVMLTVFSIIIAQYMEPAIANSMKPLKEMDWPRMFERLLKLALPNTYCWLVMFYCLFHLWLNILAEVLRFGDREFYKDWWNSPTLGDYWKLWNMPVHKWLLRHVYFPAVRLGMSRWWAVILVFFVSAVFHELVLGVPLHCVRLWSFMGIMLQVPMIIFTEHLRKRLNRDEAGNYVFWLTFCVVGQPLSILLYAHDYLYSVRPHLEAASHSS